MRNETLLIPAERRSLIQEIIHREGIVRVADLSVMLDVSEITVRRDLDILEQNGILERTHGGAIYSQRMEAEPFYREKDNLQRKEKDLIGRKAATLVADGETIMINSGSTTRRIFPYLHKHTNLRVVTSNLSAVYEVQALSFELVLLGGTYREQSNSLIGPLAIMNLTQIYASKCFIGVDGISPKYGLTTPNLSEAEIARMMIERTHGMVIITADHTKLGVVAETVTAPIEKAMILITDPGFDELYRKELEDLGLKILIADP